MKTFALRGGGGGAFSSVLVGLGGAEGVVVVVVVSLRESAWRPVRGVMEGALGEGSESTKTLY